MSRLVVLDSSALLCDLNGEAGAARVAEALPSAVISAANPAEAVAMLRDPGPSAEKVQEVQGGLHLGARPLTPAQACATGHLRPDTRALGLSLEDRACLALAAEPGATALTADQTWGGPRSAHRSRSFADKAHDLAPPCGISAG